MMQRCRLGSWSTKSRRPIRTLVSESDDIQDVVEDWSSLLRFLTARLRPCWGEDTDEILDTGHKDVGRLDPRVISVHIAYSATLTPSHCENSKSLRPLTTDWETASCALG